MPNIWSIVSIIIILFLFIYLVIFSFFVLFFSFYITNSFFCDRFLVNQCFFSRKQDWFAECTALLFGPYLHFLPTDHNTKNNVLRWTPTKVARTTEPRDAHLQHDWLTERLLLLQNVNKKWQNVDPENVHKPNDTVTLVRLPVIH